MVVRHGGIRHVGERLVLDVNADRRRQRKPQAGNRRNSRAGSDVGQVGKARRRRKGRAERFVELMQDSIEGAVLTRRVVKVGVLDDAGKILRQPSGQPASKRVAGHGECARERAIALPRLDLAFESLVLLG